MGNGGTLTCASTCARFFILTTKEYCRFLPAMRLPNSSRAKVPDCALLTPCRKFCDGIPSRSAFDSNFRITKDRVVHGQWTHPSPYSAEATTNLIGSVWC